jgi:signal transduction histidine kinase
VTLDERQHTGLASSGSAVKVAATPELDARARRADSALSVRDRLRAYPSSLRMRILALVLGLLALATVLFVGVTYTVLAVRLDQRIDADLTQEANELRRLASGTNPATGEPFGTDVKPLFDLYFERNVPSKNEALIALVDGEPYVRSRQVVPYRLDRDPELVARWGALRDPEREQVDTPAGRVDYYALPLNIRGRTEGVFVAAMFRDRLQSDYDEAVLAAGATGVGVLLLGSLLAWRLAGRVVDPVSRLTRTARAISETDLSRRIPVDGRDEVAQQAETFNEMLDRLERAFQTQRQFVNDAGHELRTPLTIVMGNLDLLPEDPDERQETIALVMDELERMNRIVGDLLLLARREQSDFLELETIEMGSLTDELASKTTALAPREWIVESRGQGIVVADRQRLTQAVLQLAENAVSHGGREGPIWLGTDVSYGVARLWVRDRGIGIAREDQALVFDRFRRAEHGIRTDGSGLGLPIVKAIAEGHHGRVELESSPGEGAKFTIVIPVDQHHEEELI